MKCPVCNGSGKCQNCDGNGILKSHQGIQRKKPSDIIQPQSPFDSHPSPSEEIKNLANYGNPCPVCHGSGQCQQCNGTGLNIMK